MNNRWTEVSESGSNNQRWEPQKEQFDPNNPQRLIGYLKRITERQGTKAPFQVAEIAVVNPDGKTYSCVDVSGGVVLANKLQEIPLNKFICIAYKGKVSSKTPGVNPYNDWKVFVDENAIPFDQSGLVAATQQQAPAAQAPQQAAAFQQQQQQAPAFNQPAAPAIEQRTFIPAGSSIPPVGQASAPANNGPVFNGNPSLNNDDLPF